MSFVECCKKRRKATSYDVIPELGFVSCTIKVIDELCPHCGGYVIDLERIDLDGNKSTVHKENSAAYKLWDKLENSIISKTPKNNIIGGRFYLNYNEYGTKKKCYSNLSTLKMGLTDNSIGIDEYLKSKFFVSKKSKAC